MRKNFLIFILLITIFGLVSFIVLKVMPESKKTGFITPTPTEKLIGGDKDEHGCLIAAGYSWCEEKQKCLRTWEEPCVLPTIAPTIDESAVLKAAIKQALIAKHGSNANELTITVSKIEGDYASGGASGEGGGGMWFGAKVNTKWVLVWDGNGTISCKDFEAYPKFPTSLLPECYDEKTDKPAKR